MKQFALLLVVIFGTAIVQAANISYIGGEQLAWAPNDTTQDSTEKDLEKTLDEIVEEENWKDRKSDTEWRWDWDWHKGDDDIARKSGRKHGFFRGGAGGWDNYYLPVDLSALNNSLVGTGVSKFPKDMFLYGGGGFGFVGKNIRLGGLGAGGELLATGTVDGLQREIKLGVGFGGFTIDKVFHPFNKTEIGIGLMTGGGTAELELTQWSGPVGWSDIVGGYSVASDTSASRFHDYQNKMSTNYFSCMPSVSFRYNVFRWFAVGAHVGYLYTRMDQQGWKMEGKKIEGFPDFDLSGVIYRLSFYFGG